MAAEIRIPRLGWSMEQGTFLGWLKKDGEPVKVGDALYELEGEKATQEIEAVDAGVLRIPADAPKPGAVLAVGSLLGYVTAPGEALPATQPTAAQPTEPVAEPEPAPPAEPPVASPAVRRLARELKVSLAAVAGSGPAGRVSAADVRSANTASPAPARTAVAAASSASRSSGRQVASPRARRVARELGIDWSRITGTGARGRIRERDVRAAAVHKSSAVPVAGVPAFVPVTSRRRTIAQRMLQSQQQSAPVTLTCKVEATNLVSLRQQFQATQQAGIVPSMTVIIAKLVASALQHHPLLAGRWEGDKIMLPAARDWHVGVAVDTEDGLLVPVLRDVIHRGLTDLAQEWPTLLERARQGRLTAQELQGSVFTITNLGTYGIDAFTPVINMPETAILGLGTIRREAVVLADDRIVPREQMTLSLTFDHRVVDGAPAAKFLQTVCSAIENPSAWLLSSG